MAPTISPCYPCSILYYVTRPGNYRIGGGNHNIVHSVHNSVLALPVGCGSHVVQRLEFFLARRFLSSAKVYHSSNNITTYGSTIALVCREYNDNPGCG